MIKLSNHLVGRAPSYGRVKAKANVDSCYLVQMITFYPRKSNSSDNFSSSI